MSDQHFEFKPLSEENLYLLTDWLAKPHLQQWWRQGEVTVEHVREKYLPRISGDEDAKPFIVYLEDKAIGYIQYYQAGTNPDWWPDTPGEGVLGIDQFIAHENLLNQGIGSRFIAEFIRMLMNDSNVREIRVDPHPDNLRAIACYKKVGFEIIEEITTPDGPAIMMVLSNTSIEEN